MLYHVLCRIVTLVEEGKLIDATKEFISQSIKTISVIFKSSNHKTSHGSDSVGYESLKLNAR